MNQRTCITLSAALAAALVLGGCPPQATVVPSPQEMASLVDQLAEADGQRWSPSPTAVAAYERLKGLGIASFPALVEGLEDRRPSAIKMDMAPDTPVSAVCEAILESQVAPFRYEKSGPHYFWEHDARSWWAQRQGTPLRELQIEVVAWTIQRLKADAKATGYPRPRRLAELERVLDRLQRGQNP